MVIVWLALASAALSFLVIVIGVVEFARSETPGELTVAPQPTARPSFDSGVLVPMLGGVVVGSLLSMAVPCSFSESMVAHHIAILAGSAGLAVVGAVVFLRWRKRDSRFWIAGSVLVAMSSIVLFVPIAKAERCERDKARLEATSAQKDGPPRPSRQVGRDIGRWLGSGMALQYASVETTTRRMGVPVLQPARQDLRALAHAARGEITVSGLLATLVWPMLLGIFMLGFGQWMSRARWRRVLGTGVVGLTSALVFPVCFGLLSVALSQLVWREAALGFWISGAVLGLVVSLLVTVGLASIGPSMRAVAST